MEITNQNYMKKPNEENVTLLLKVLYSTTF